jgi:small subunit ribosomal protein S17
MTGEPEEAVEEHEPAVDARASEPAADPAAAEAPAPATEAPAEEVPAPVTPAAAEPAPERRTKKRLPRALRRKRQRPVRDPSAPRKPIVRLPKPEGERGAGQERRGVVVSAAMDKTIVVKVDTIKAHRRYKKVVRRSRKFHAHDEANRAKPGDVVRIVETRPISKTKTWRLAEILQEAR